MFNAHVSFFSNTSRNLNDALILKEESVFTVQHVFALSANNKILSKRIHHGILNSSIRKRLPCKYRCNGNNGIILGKQISSLTQNTVMGISEAKNLSHLLHCTSGLEKNV